MNAAISQTEIDSISPRTTIFSAERSLDSVLASLRTTLGMTCLDVYARIIEKSFCTRSGNRAATGGFHESTHLQQPQPVAGYEFVRSIMKRKASPMKRLLQFGLLSIGLSFSAAHSASAQVPTVFVENYRNDNCGNCRIPDIEFEEWIEQNKSTVQVDVLYLHNEITDPQDPFYKASEVDVDFRSGVNFYNISSNPRVYVQGFDAGTTIGDWKTFVGFAAQQPKQATIAVSELKSLGNDQYSMKVNATNSSGKQVRLYAALMESGIIFDNPKAYGNPPSGKWDHIFRKMLPDRDGSTDFGASTEQTLTFNLTGKNWDIANMNAVVFVQDVAKISGNSRAIYGHTVVDLSSLKAAVAPVKLNGFSIKSLSNPFTSTAPIEVRLGQHGHLRLEMFDMTGKMISTLADNSLSEGVYSFDAMQDGMTAGTYLVNAFVDGNFAGQVKLVKQ